MLITVMAVGFLMVAGLIYDGSLKIRAARDTTTAAFEASRAAAQSIAPNQILGANGGTPPTIDTYAATAAASNYLAAAGIQGTTTIQGTTITVTTHSTWQPLFLSTFGAGPQTVTGHASAQLGAPPP